MTAEQEVRRELESWFVSSRKKDLDALMEKIAPDVVSYEHDSPLQYKGVDDVREVCRVGLESAPEIEWDVPDLQVLVRDDIAVTWGLNRMRGKGEDGEPFEMWSRGTRIFQKRDGRWQVIHQHVSFPYDAESGQARVDLKP